MEEIRSDEELLSLRRRLEERWADRNSEIDFFRRMRFMEIVPHVPAAYRAYTVRTPTAHQIIERMTGTLTTNPFTLTVPPSANTAKAQESSSLIEKWTMLALEQLQKQSGEDLVERFVEHLLTDGHACWRILYARNYWEGQGNYPQHRKNESDAAFERRARSWYPKREKGEKGEDYDARTEQWKKGRPLPISWSVVDPINVFPMFSEMGLVCVLETDHRDIATLRPDQWDLTKKSPAIWELIRGEPSAQGQVEFTQVWYPNSRIYAVNGHIVDRQKHQYGAPPYIYATGINSTSREAGKAGLSVLYPLRYILPKRDEVLSQKLTACSIYGWPTPIWKIGEKRGIGRDGNLQELRADLIPGEAMTLWPDEDMGFLEWKGSTPDIDELIGMLTTFCEQAGLSPALYGIGQSGESGYRLNQLVAAAKMKFKPIITHTERALEQLVHAFLDIVEFQVQETLYLYSKGKENMGWIGLGPDDLSGYRQVEANLSPVMPTDAYAKSSMIINQVTHGLLDVRSALEELGREQPEEIMDAMLADEWKRDPRVKAALIEEAVKRMKLKLAKNKEVAIGELIQLLPSLPPAFQQAVMMVLQGGGQQAGGGPGGMPGMGAPGMRPPPVGVMAAPGVQAAPQPGAPSSAAMVGRQVRPAGIRQGAAPMTQSRPRGAQ